jgi:hypothetical protein
MSETGAGVVAEVGQSSVSPTRGLYLLAAFVVVAVLACCPSLADAAPASETSLGWGPIQPGTTGGSETLARAVACPSTSQCTAVDTQGQQVTFDPTEPGHPIATTIDLDDALAGVACPTSSQCTAVDNEGKLVTFDPVEPASATITDPSLDSIEAVACPSSSECIGVGNPSSNVVIFDPLAPSDLSIAPLDPENGLGAVACPSPTQCTAVDLLGQQVTFDPLAPGDPAPSAIDAPNWLDGLACPSTSQCTAVDDKGLQVTFNPTAPGDPTPIAIAAGEWLEDVACPSLTQCTALGERDEVTFDPTEAGGEKVAPIAINSFAGALVCPSASQCTAVGGSEEITFDPLELPLPPENTGPPTAEPGRLGPGGLHERCRSAVGCIVDDLASEMTFAGQLITLRAPSANACVVAGGRLAVAINSAPIEHSRAARLTFSAAAFYLDKGVARKHEKTERTAAGRRTTVTVTTYAANTTARRLPATVQPLIAGLAPGVHTLTIKLYYKRTRGTRGPGSRLTITRTLTTKFNVC